MTSYSLRRQRPLGLTDLVYEEAALKGRIESTLCDTFRRWGYQRIILPTVGYYESLSTGASDQLRRQMYRFFDREGQILALRPDMTVPTARVVGTTLYDQPRPLRLYYLGNVFRYERPQAGQRREFTQAGIELVGADSAASDAEALLVAMSALESLGIVDYRINLGQTAFLRALLREVTLDDRQMFRLETSISRKNDIEIAATLDELAMSGRLAEAVARLPHLCGGIEVVEEAHALATNDEARLVLDRLRRIEEILKAEEMADRVLYDLGEVRGMAYYTGISFHSYVEGLGFHLCSGGRYDSLIGNFGPDMPAVGFALGVERAMLVSDGRRGPCVDLVLSQTQTPCYRRIAALARSRGLVIEIDVLPREEEAFFEYARSKGAKRAIYCATEQRCIVESEGDRMTSSPETLLREFE